MSREGNQKLIFKSLMGVAVAVAVIAIVVVLLSGSTTGDITVSGGGSIEGLKCTDDKLLHPVFRDVRPVSYTNIITANFIDNSLSSVMYRYDGLYRSEDEASRARVFAEADYNLILTDEYGVKINIFSHTFMSDGAKVGLTITGNADKITSRTAPYFLLDSLADFPSTLDELRVAYESKGFSCVVHDSK